MIVNSTKNILKVNYLIIFTLLTFLVSGQNAGNGAVLSFDKEYHSYGVIHVDDVPSGNIFQTEITFRNTGNQKLVIDSVRVCCNVTLIDYSKELMPDNHGSINVELKIHQRVPHRINRGVVIYSNCIYNPVVTYKLRGRLVRD